jgi:hypothetical protein
MNEKIGMTGFTGLTRPHHRGTRGTEIHYRPLAMRIGRTTKIRLSVVSFSPHVALPLELALNVHGRWGTPDWPSVPSLRQLGVAPCGTGKKTEERREKKAKGTGQKE